MKKRITALMLALGLAVSVSACGNSSSAPASLAPASSAPASSAPASSAPADSTPASSAAEETDAPKLEKIGWSTDILSSNFTSGIATAFQESCDALGIELEIQDANRDMSLQITQVENMIANGCQVIVVKPYDTSACEPISTACEEAGVPLVVICSDIVSHYDCAVMVDNATIGQLKAQAIVDALGGEGNVAFIHGTLSQAGWVAQADAAKELFAEYPGITVVDEQLAENNAQDLAISVAENWITAGTEIDAIWCSQDTVAMGAGTAFKEAGKEAFIVGQGGMEDAQIAIRDGVIDATIYLPSKVYVDGAMKAAQALFAGEEIDHDLYMETPVLNAENLDSFEF